jgi:hypothetical protein
MPISPLAILVLVSTALSACGAGLPSMSTDTTSSGMVALADKQAFVERHVQFRRSCDALDFAVRFRDGGDGSLPAPSEWDVRLVARVPAAELDDWIWGLSPEGAPDTGWVSEIPNHPGSFAGFEWHADKNRTVGIERESGIVLYRNRSL